jgi:hypothetical protein
LGVFVALHRNLFFAEPVGKQWNQDYAKQRQYWGMNANIFSENQQDIG